MAAWPVELPPTRVERAKQADDDRGLEAAGVFVGRPPGRSAPAFAWARVSTDSERDYRAHRYNAKLGRK
jgi:hypothetical protein